MRTLLLAGVVVAHAAVQTLLVVGDPVPAAEPGFVLRALASAAALLVALVTVTVVLSRARRVVPVAATAVVLLALAAAAILVHPLAPALVLLIGAALLPAVALGARPARGRRHPLTAALWVLGVAATLVLTRVVGVLAGLFLGTPLGAAVIWLVGGAVAVVVLAVTTALLRGPAADAP